MTRVPSGDTARPSMFDWSVRGLLARTLGLGDTSMRYTEPGESPSSATKRMPGAPGDAALSSAQYCSWLSAFTMPDIGPIVVCGRQGSTDGTGTVAHSLPPAITSPTGRTAPL